MDRRSMLGKLLATVAGLFWAGKVRASESALIDTTSMYNQTWRTKQPADSLPNPTHRVTEVDLLEIVRGDGCNGREDSFSDGFSTWIKIDGKMLGGHGGINESPRFEKVINLSAVAGEPLAVFVEYGDRSTELFYPKRFDLTLGDVRVQIHPDFCPCRILIGGYEPHVSFLNITFEEGVVPWVDIRIKPHQEDK